MPGEPGVWVFVIGDMLVFALFFSVFLFYRALDLPTFQAGAETLNLNYGALNTLLLLLSSWLVVLAVADIRERSGRIAPKLLMGAFLCGLGFTASKGFEYADKFRAGIDVTTNDFFMYYFIFTGLHLVHVVIGMGVLIYLWSLARSDMTGRNDMAVLESGGIYWHMVDLLWIILFPLLYLLR